MLAQGGATAMMDISDGLSIDLARLCAESGVGARVRLDDVPVSTALRELANVMTLDPVDVALHGGEDYELLATLPPEALERVQERVSAQYEIALTEIGEITEDGIFVVREDGTEDALEPRGWDHFGG